MCAKICTVRGNLLQCCSDSGVSSLKQLGLLL